MSNTEFWAVDTDVYIKEGDAAAYGSSEQAVDLGYSVRLGEPNGAGERRLELEDSVNPDHLAAAMEAFAVPGSHAILRGDDGSIVKLEKEAGRVNQTWGDVADYFDHEFVHYRMHRLCERIGEMGYGFNDPYEATDPYALVAALEQQVGAWIAEDRARRSSPLSWAPSGYSNPAHDPASPAVGALSAHDGAYDFALARDGAGWALHVRPAGSDSEVYFEAFGEGPLERAMAAATEAAGAISRDGLKAFVEEGRGALQPPAPAAPAPSSPARDRQAVRHDPGLQTKAGPQQRSSAPRQ